MQDRAFELLSGYLTLLHGRGSIRPLRRAAARGLLRELRRKPAASHTQATADPHADRRRARRVPCTGKCSRRRPLKDRGGPPYPLQPYLERRGALWVVTRIGDA